MVEIGRELLEIIGRVEADHGVTIDTLDLRSSGHEAFGASLAISGKSEEAHAEIQKAVAAQRAVLEARPNDGRAISGMANVTFNRGMSFYDMGDMARALADFRAARNLYTRAVTADPGDTRYQYHVVSIQDNIATTLFGLDRLPEALALFEQAAEGHRKLVAAYPLVADLRRQFAQQRGESCEALALLGLVADARVALDEGFRMIDPLVKAVPGVLRFQSVRADLLAWRGIVELLAGRPEDAAAPLREAHEFWTALIKKDDSLFAWAAPNLAEVAGYLGLVERAAGRPARAAELFRECIAHYGKAFYNAKGTGFLAGAHAGLAGLAGVEGSGIPAADGPALADKAMATLRRAVERGYRRRTWLVKFPAYDSLRGRADFQKLLAEMEATNAAEAAKDKDAGSKQDRLE